MIRIIDNYNDADKLLWSGMVARASNGSFFQTPDYFRVLK